MAIVLEDLQERLRAIARPEESPDALLEMAVSDFIARREQEAARGEAAKASALEELNGPFRPHAESMALAYQRLGLRPPADRAPETPEERAERAEATLDALPPEKIAELEQLGLL